MYSKSSCFLSPRKWWQRDGYDDLEECDYDTRDLCSDPDDRDDSDRDIMEVEE